MLNLYDMNKNSHDLTIFLSSPSVNVMDGLSEDVDFLYAHRQKDGQIEWLLQMHLTLTLTLKIFELKILNSIFYIFN
jgi:hypothetical protein